jgi:hypothetical protein
MSLGTRWRERARAKSKLSACDRRKIHGMRRIPKKAIGPSDGGARAKCVTNDYRRGVGKAAIDQWRTRT